MSHDFEPPAFFLRLGAGSFAAVTYISTHAALGALALGLLYWHTGFSLGENLNRWLMLSFLGVGIVGITAALLTRLQASMPAMGRLRQGSTWLHILVCWPLPVLLLFHVLSAYYF